MPKGKTFERLIAGLERTLAVNSNVTIEAPKRIRDKTTGAFREHDIMLSTKQGHHSLTIAIECRDRSRPITVDQVEGFWKKCQDTGVNQGIIVSSKGFYNTARKKASHLGIRCLDIEKMETFDWLLAPGIRSILKRIIHTKWTFFPEEEGVIDGSGFEIIDVNGDPVSQAILTANARKQLNKFVKEADDPVDEAELKVRLGGSGLVLRNLTTGATVSVKYIFATIRYAVTVKIIPFQLVKYQDTMTEENITEAAFAAINFGDQSGKLMIAYKKDEGGHVVFIQNKDT